MKKLITLLFVTAFAIGCNWEGSGCPNCECGLTCCESGNCATTDCGCPCK